MKTRWSWVYLCGLFLGGFCFLGGNGGAWAQVALEQDGSAPTLRMMTYNIRHAEGTDDQVDLNRIAQIINAQAPQVVCLQEVDRYKLRSGFVDQPAKLAQLTGMQAVFYPNVDEGLLGEYGNALLTTLPVISSQNILLPVNEGNEQRGCLKVQVLFETLPVTILCTHLGLVIYERLGQSQVIMGQAVGADPVLLAGDFNESPAGTSIKKITRRLSDAAATHPLPTIPAVSPTRRIDCIFHSPWVQTLWTQVPSTAEVLVASDHRPLVGEFDLLNVPVELSAFELD